MIPIIKRKAPKNFNEKVKQPGLKWLKTLGHPPKNNEWANHDYWTKYNEELYNAYSGICAYLAIYFDFVTGASSTDHFIPKSKKPQLAYEWSNFRLSCLGANRRKGTKTILDPFTIQKNTFFINFLNGRIYPNPKLSQKEKKLAEETIIALQLDDEKTRKMRRKHFQNYRKKEYSKDWLQKNSPFVYQEMERKGYL
jgi:uncharacterized protein (TIGR02646 family)